jgi:hypothetical protein
MFNFDKIQTVDQALSIFIKLENRVIGILKKQQSDLNKTKSKLKEAELRKANLEFEIRRSGDILKKIQPFTGTVATTANTNVKKGA